MRSWTLERAMAIVATLGIGSLGTQTVAQQETPQARGVVYLDQNENGTRDEGEPGLADVRVSNGKEIVLTDETGTYRLPVTNDTAIFVIKPRGYRTPLNEDFLPQFYYIHKPEGSPELRFGGVAPTGPLPESIDFPLIAQEEPDTFQAILFGDTQPTTQQDVDFIAHDVIEQIVTEGTDARFGVTLGDIANNDLSLFPNINRAVAMIGLPWYNVIGNHDINFDAADDKTSDETFERVFGPSYYSFDYGPVHFMALDDIMWSGSTPDKRGRYTGGFGEEQMEFIRNDLALIPEDQLVVLMMHIPLVGVADRMELYRLIEKRPYAFSVSAHTHYQEHRFIGEEDGWKGDEPHHHMITVTVCGSWWRGQPDENGIPHTTMRDGAPNGYQIVTFDGNKYDLTFRAARRPAGHQMNIYIPEETQQADCPETTVTVNVFNGSSKSTVEMRLSGTEDWIALEKVNKPDPFYLEMKRRENLLAAQLKEGELPWRNLPDPGLSSHLWQVNLPSTLEPGTYRVEVRTTDMHGKTYEDSRSFRVIPDALAATTSEDEN